MTINYSHYRSDQSKQGLYPADSLPEAGKKEMPHNNSASKESCTYDVTIYSIGTRPSGVFA